MSNLSNKTNTLGGDTIRLTFAKTLTLLISTITGMLLVRFRTLEEYGTYSALLLVVNLLVSLLLLGLPNSVNFFLARAESDEKKRHFLSVYYTLNTIFSILIGFILVATMPLIERYFKNEAIKHYFFFLAFYPWASIIISSLDNVLIVYKKASILVIYKIVYSIVLLFAVLIIHWFNYDFLTYMIIFVVVNGIFAVAVYFITTWISGGIKIAIDPQLVRTILVFSIPIGLSSMVGTISAEIDKMLIGRLMDSSQLAIYSNAAKELPLSVVSTSITAVLLPHVVRLEKKQKKQEAIQLWKDSTELSFIIMSLLVSGIFTFAEDVVTLLYSSKYLPGVNVFRVYSLALLVRCTYFGMILNATGETKKILICSIANLVLNAILNPLFYLLFGMIGPAIATIVSMISISFLMLYMTAKVSSVHYSVVFPWKSVGLISVFNIVFAFFFSFVKKVCPLDQYLGSFFESIIIGALWASFYYLIMKKRIKKKWVAMNTENSIDG